MVSRRIGLEKGIAVAEVTTYSNYINGEWVPAKSGETFENRNPANTDDLIGLFASSGAEDVDAAVAAAAEAFPAWRATSAIARATRRVLPWDTDVHTSKVFICVPSVSRVCSGDRTGLWNVTATATTGAGR